MSWTKSLVKKWLNIRSNPDDFHADSILFEDRGEEWISNFSGENACGIKKIKTDGSIKRGTERNKGSKIVLDPSYITDVNNYRVFAATWNVGGKSPSDNLNLEDWLHTSPPADIYVLGFQEIVPLNAGNVLGTEDDGPARKWLALIRKTLNSIPGTSVRDVGYQTPSPAPEPIVELNDDFEGSLTVDPLLFYQRPSFHPVSCSMRMTCNEASMLQPRLDRRFSVCGSVRSGNLMSGCDPYGEWCVSSDDENDDSHRFRSHSPVSYGGFVSMENRDRKHGQSRYCLVASKQMVGVYATVWIKSDLRDHVHNLKVSCVGRGLMGYLGNKGSISISMTLQQTSFCFVCCHLTSGQKEGDELRRNADVMEILRKTRFPRVDGSRDENSPQTILEHDRIIWLGDLNYRISLSYQNAKALVEMHNWKALLENDQLRIEQRRGRAFVGWHEGSIYFPPTYKYSNNSDRYAGDEMHPNKRRRRPAWCDRILWYGQGLHQISYIRGESRFSDHRPVFSMFLAEVESITHTRNKKNMNLSRIEVEELLPRS